ncbi:MAG: hypothetical protein JW801_00600 [Bacteroidales bacterium]|nr:hypothetical protein [Bacteroidales bacterium]
MKPTLRKFLLQTVILGILLILAGFILFSTLLSGYFHPLIPVILIVAVLINIFTFRLMIQSTSKILQTIIKSFSLKFLSYIALTIVIVLVEKGKTERIILIATEFFLYIIFTFHEVNSFIRKEKNDFNK